MTDAPLWSPSSQRTAQSNMLRFISFVNERRGTEFSDYFSLWRWSTESLSDFWSDLWDFLGIISDGKGDPVLIDADKMPGAQFFPQAQLNFAENILHLPTGLSPDDEALTFQVEDKIHRKMTRQELYDLTARLCQALIKAGLKKGDVVGGYVANTPETLAAMLAVTALGGVWTSCSPDFGAAGVIDRFGQTCPRFLFAVDGYIYNGKRHDAMAKLSGFITDLPSVEKVIVLPLLSDLPDEQAAQTSANWPGHAKHLSDLIAPFNPEPIPFERINFNDPLYILYSSGTTGKPKCIIHRAGGTLLMHMKEHVLHCDIKPGDRVFFFTTCGWMMWNWLMTSLAAGATLMLYDGSPFYPDGNVLFDYAQEEDCSLFGISAKYIDACAKAGLSPVKTHQLPHLRTICSTGSPLSPESFDYIYQMIKADVQLASMSGGTDLMACFIGGAPTLPVWRGEIQAPMLAMAVDVFDENGKSLYANPQGDQANQGQTIHKETTQGELVCTRPFPTMPIAFHNDPGNKRYQAAYFDFFPGIWTHGDYISGTAHKGFIVSGRSDATLNPGGVRIGTAEIYRQVESLDFIQESIVIGQKWDHDVRVVLFVQLKEGFALDPSRVQAIKTRIRQNCTPRHVPAKVLAVSDIPRTRSGKITEIAVRDVVHNLPVKNVAALANPEALDLYRDLPELQTP